MNSFGAGPRVQAANSSTCWASTCVRTFRIDLGRPYRPDRNPALLDRSAHALPTNATRHERIWRRRSALGSGSHSEFLIGRGIYTGLEVFVQDYMWGY
jgi:hypothetical protein